VKRHERESIVAKARSDFLKMYIDWLQEHDVTYIEAAKILAEEQASLLKFALREERHGDDSIPAGLASPKRTKE
jgi:hypothetical protein